MFRVIHCDYKAGSIHSIWHIVDFVKGTGMVVQDIELEITRFFTAHSKSFLGDERFKTYIKETPEVAWALVSDLSFRRGSGVNGDQLRAN